MAANVNKPTNIKQKEADINRKLQIYGIISAFKQGKVPSVREIQAFLKENQSLARTDSPCRTIRSMLP
jgi:hypothetical protein